MAINPVVSSPDYMAMLGYQSGAGVFKKNATTSSPASIMIGERMLSLFGATEAANGNVSNASSMLRTTGSALGSIGESIATLKSLAIQANNDMLTDADRSAINEQAKVILQQIDDWVANTKHNGKDILKGGTLQLASGGGGQMSKLDMPDASRSNLGIQSVDLSTSQGARDAIAALDEAMDTFTTQYTSIGSQQSALEKIYSANLASQAELYNGGSRLTDTDMALFAMRSAQAMIMAQVGTAVQTQGMRIDSQAASAAQGGA